MVPGFLVSNARAMLVAEKMGLCAGGPVGIGNLARRRPRALGYHAACVLKRDAPRTLLWLTACGRKWRLTCEAMSSRFARLAYIKRRYLEHPENRYEVVAVVPRWTSSNWGVGPAPAGKSSVELLDVVAPPQATATLIDHAAP